MFQPNWPSSVVQIVMVRDSAAHCNAVFFPPIVVAASYFGYVGYHQFYLGVLGLHMVALLFVVGAVVTKTPTTNDCDGRPTPGP
jgi:uncharacterized membrane protein